MSLQSFSQTLLQTLSQSRRNGIWALLVVVVYSVHYKPLLLLLRLLLFDCRGVITLQAASVSAKHDWLLELQNVKLALGLLTVNPSYKQLVFDDSHTVFSPIFLS